MREGFMVSLRRKKALSFFLPISQRFCEGREKTCHPHFKNGGAKVQRLRDAVDE